MVAILTLADKLKDEEIAALPQETQQAIAQARVLKQLEVVLASCSAAGCVYQDVEAEVQKAFPFVPKARKQLRAPRPTVRGGAGVGGAETKVEKPESGDADHPVAAMHGKARKERATPNQRKMPVTKVVSIIRTMTAFGSGIKWEKVGSSWDEFFAHARGLKLSDVEKEKFPWLNELIEVLQPEGVTETDFINVCIEKKSVISPSRK